MALGDSITFGIGASPIARGYAYRVAHLLKAKHFHNLGIPGATLPSSYDLELSGALSSRPALATIFFGANDIRGGVKRSVFLRDLNDLVVTLRRARAQVVIVGLPDLALAPAVRAQFPHLHPTIVSWNQGMKAVARARGAHFVDLDRFSAELAAHPGYISSDGLHPSNAGHARLASIIVTAAIRDGAWPHP